MDKNNLEQSLHIITNREYSMSSREFQQSSRILWNEIVVMAVKINPKKAEEMTSTLFMRLMNRRQAAFQPIATPKAYVYTALKNIQKDIWRSEKRTAGFTDHLGEYHHHRSLDEFVADSNQSLHEKIAAPLMDYCEEDDGILQLSGLKEMVRVHLFHSEPNNVPAKSRKGRRTFLTAAEDFESFASGTCKIHEPTQYKKFDRQRKKMLAHLEAKLPSVESKAYRYIVEFLSNNDLFTKREHKIKEAKKDEKVNPVIVHRQIEVEFVFRALLDYLDRQGKTYGVEIADLQKNKIASGLLAHCQYQLFYLEMFRTKKQHKDSLTSMYTSFVQE